MEDFFHSHIEEITNKIIKPIEHELTNTDLNKDEQRKVIKEIMMWLILFSWAKEKNNG